MSDPKAVASAYLDTWNQRDPRARADLLQIGWTEDARYVDPLMAADSRNGIGALVEAVQGKFPDYVFRMLGAPDGHGDYVRLSWSLGPRDGLAPVEGSDVIEVRGGRILRVIGFIDKAPTGT